MSTINWRRKMFIEFNERILNAANYQFALWFDKNTNMFLICAYNDIDNSAPLYEQFGIEKLRNKRWEELKEMLLLKVFKATREYTPYHGYSGGGGIAKVDDKDIGLGCAHIGEQK
jgi:hypothetical protein